MPSKDILPFKKYQQKFRMKTQRQRPGLSEAVWEIEEDPDLQLSEHGALLKKLAKNGRKVCVHFTCCPINIDDTCNPNFSIRGNLVLKKRTF